MSSSRAKLSNQGIVSLLADLALARFRLVVVGSSANHVKYPAAVADRPVGVTLDGADAAEAPVAVALLGKGDTKTVTLNGTCSKGDRLTLEAYSTDAYGKARAMPTAAGTYYCIGTALEDGVDEQEIAIEDCVPYKVIIQATIADLAAVTQDTLTDSSGGTAATTIAAITGTTNAGSADLAPVQNAIASLAAQLAKVKTDGTAVRTKVNAILVALETAETVNAS